MTENSLSTLSGSGTRHTVGSLQRNWAVPLLAILFAATPLFGPGPTLALTNTFDADADVWTDQAAQATNHGSAQTLHVKGRATSKQRTLVRFALSDLPACATVSEARLRLHVDSNSLSTSVSHRVHRMIVDWSEDGATWLTRDGTNPWVGGNGGAAGSDFASTETAIAATGTGAGFVEWDVTPDVQALLEGADNYGWIVKHATEGGADTNGNNTIVEYASREAAANHPQLVVTYEHSDANCDDANPCTDETCTASGCDFTNNTNACDDGDACTDGDTCSEGSCAGGPPLDCDDENECTDDSCDQILGCQVSFNTNACDDGDACTDGDVCGGGTCASGAALDCDDGIECTADSCDSQTGCSNSPNAGACDDSNACTDDACDADLGCQSTPNTDPCDDGDTCTDGDTCSEGSCAGGPPLDCDDGIECTTDSCDSQNGCVNTTDSGSCDDGNLCTVDICVPGEGCANDATPVSGCRTAVKSTLLIKDNSDNAKDKLLWKWSKGEATSQAEFGSPLTTTDYALCIYAGPDEEFLTGVTVPSHATLWKSLSTKGFKYKDKSGAADGVQGLLVKGSPFDKSRAVVKAKGQSVPDAALGDLPLPIVAQLLTSDTSVCWEATFSSIRKNTADKLKAKK